jgi:hypothetical protein
MFHVMVHDFNSFIFFLAQGLVVKKCSFKLRANICASVLMKDLFVLSHLQKMCILIHKESYASKHVCMYVDYASARVLRESALGISIITPCSCTSQDSIYSFMCHAEKEKVVF